MELAGIGIEAEPERVYRYVLGRPGSLPADVAAGLNLNLDAVDAALHTLTAARLIRVLPGLELCAVDPAVGVERLIEERMNRLNEELRSAAAARGAVSVLAAISKNAQPAEPRIEVQKVEGLGEVRNLLEELAFFAHREVLALQPGSVLTREMIEAARPLDLRCLRRGVTLRTVVQIDAVSDPAVADYIIELVDLGAAIRAVDHPMERMIVFDRSVAVVPVDPGSSGRGAIVVRQPGLVANMIALFERVWTSASDVRPLVDGSATTTLPSALERQVLNLLSETDTDEAGARRLHVSVRTYRRYVADLLARLGASNRFQAAARAKDRGWI